MTINQRLKISYVALVVVPFVLFFVASTFILSNVITGINDIKLSVQTEEFNKELYYLLGNEPDSLLKKENLENLISLTTKPERITSYVIIDNQIKVVVGNNLESIKDEIHAQRFLNYWIFSLKDGSTATIFFIISEQKKYHFYQKLVIPVIFYIILISLLAFLTARKITRPLAKLKNAAISIKNEEFDLDLKYNSNDEIKDVFIAFDEMRVRLKHNVEKQLLYEKNRTELIANISHDLKTPITAIKGYIEGILDGVANTPEKLKKYNQTILKKVNTLDKLIENLFLSSKLELRNVHFHFQKLNINIFINDIIDEIKYDAKNLEIEMNLLKEQVFVLGDPIQLQRVVNNLISNSIKYNNKDICKLKISVSSISNFLTISISDNGPGIVEENKDIIFEQFYRSDPARSSQTKGSGLGLSIAKQIITEHNGSITAYNNENRGLTVSFTLPLTKDTL